MRVAFVFRSVEGGTDIDKGEKDVLLQNLGSGVAWSTRTSGKFRKKTNENRSVFACGFVNEAECPYCVEVLENKTTHRWTVKIGTRPHSDHTRVKRMYVQSENGKPKLSKFAKSLVTEKHVTGTGSTADMIADVHQSGVALDEQGQKMLVMYRQNELRKLKKTAGVKEADRPTLATFHNSWNEYTKEAIAKRTAREAGEDEEGASWALLGEGGDEEEIAGGDHTAFLAGWKQWSGADSSGKIVTKWCYVASSNNLLRNAYRAYMQSDTPSLQIQLDATFRVNAEGFAHIVCGFSDSGWLFHVVAYASVSNDDQQTHAVFTSIVKNACEAEIRKCQIAQTKV